MARRRWCVGALTVVATYFATDIFQRLGVNPGISAIGAGVAFLAGGWFICAAPLWLGLRDERA